MAKLDDMDDAPELDEAFFAEAQPMRQTLTAEQQRAFKMGRPKSANPKTQVTLRLDADLIAKFKAGGPGWQTRINAALWTASNRDAAAKREAPPKRNTAHKARA
jgi:uncharacterized protein (DUF4415 family)